MTKPRLTWTFGDGLAWLFKVFDEDPGTVLRFELRDGTTLRITAYEDGNLFVRRESEYDAMTEESTP